MRFLLPLPASLIGAAILLGSVLSPGIAGETSPYEQESLQDSLVPINRAGETPFWNGNAVQFKCAPVFEFRIIPGASSYRIEAFFSGNSASFESLKPSVPLTPIWGKISAGDVVLTVSALNPGGAPIGYPQVRRFIRGMYFRGPYGSISTAKDTAAKQALKAVFELQHIQHWKEAGTPDSRYDHYVYPAKIVGAVIDCMVVHSSMSGEPVKSDALLIAKKAADYLLSISEPGNAAFPHFPPTYQGEKLTAGKYAGQVLIPQAAEAGMSYLRLYRATNENRFLNAALNIGNTLQKTQNSEGTWLVKYFLRDGKSATDRLAVPTKIARFLDELAAVSKSETYADAAKRAWNWTTEHPGRTYDWSAQFEDVTPVPPYANLSRSEAAEYAEHLFSSSDPTLRDAALELVRFCEDQFVVWEQPWRKDLTAPSALEQYRWYHSIDESTASMIRLFLSAYRSTRRPIFLAKAQSLGNALVKAQNDWGRGRIPTYLNLQKGDDYWLNCMFSSATALLELAQQD